MNKIYSETKEFEIKFGRNVLARVEITNNEPKIINAVDGWGNSIVMDEITITTK